jgi:hypothetical protein
MKTKNFAALILTHGRPDNVVTYKSLRRCGYTGKIVLVIDDKDKTLPQYKKNFGEENIAIFSKDEIAKTFDVADTLQEQNASVYPRNASFKIAKDMGLDYFIQLDDDYNDFRYRFSDKQNKSLLGRAIKSFDDTLDALIQFLEDSGAVTVAMAQGGDFIGGVGSNVYKKKLARKAMNSFIFRTNCELRFVGRMNEDVNFYVLNGIKGELIFTPAVLCVNPSITQSVDGGMTELYKNNGTYTKSMYTVMMAPSCVTVRTMGPTNPRLHHHIEWNNVTPKIISDEHRKANA